VGILVNDGGDDDDEDDDAFGKDGRGNSGNKSSQSIFLEIVVKGILKASLKLKYSKVTIKI
jgi:hypothetical protein